jgi:hypothetical protein
VIQELFCFPQKYVFSVIRKSRELLATSWEDSFVVIVPFFNGNSRPAYFNIMVM